MSHFTMCVPGSHPQAVIGIHPNSALLCIHRVPTCMIRTLSCIYTIDSCQLVCPICAILTATPSLYPSPISSTSRVSHLSSDYIYHRYSSSCSSIALISIQYRLRVRCTSRVAIPTGPIDCMRSISWMMDSLHVASDTKSSPNFLTITPKR